MLTRAVQWSRHFALALLLFTTGAFAQLPDAPGKTETIRVCKECHEIERAVSKRQDRPGWEATMDKMFAVGAKISDEDYTTILDYLVKNYAAEELPKLNVNKATAIEFESRLSLPRSQAAAVIDYRTKNGNFKSIEDLKKVPGIDVAKIEAKKDKLAF